METKLQIRNYYIPENKPAVIPMQHALDSPNYSGSAPRPFSLSHPIPVTLVCIYISIPLSSLLIFPLGYYGAGFKQGAGTAPRYSAVTLRYSGIWVIHLGACTELSSSANQRLRKSVRNAVNKAIFNY